MTRKKWLLNSRRKINVKIARVAQLVERNLAKVDVAGPSPVSRSKPLKWGLYLCIILTYYIQRGLIDIMLGTLGIYQTG